MFRTAAYDDAHEQAAALLHAVATYHPLVDGDKRAAWPAAVTFLALHGADLAGCAEDAAYDLVIDVASGVEPRSRRSRSDCGRCDLDPNHGRRRVVRASAPPGRR
ncbi:hypothetical protein ACH47C_00365 [Streptomyces rishiriensis]|uniref:hypothetical protein n=1 Tax=Streptomyces rishiriensis TaxID=68264 RepID=UPI0033DC19E6